jgi:hypothetical protein
MTDKQRAEVADTQAKILSEVHARIRARIQTRLAELDALDVLEIRAGAGHSMSSERQDLLRQLRDMDGLD